MRWLNIGIVLIFVSMVAFAQFPGGRKQGGDGNFSGKKGDMSRPMEKSEPRAAPQNLDPIIAIEHELPSLAVDLRLTPQQAGLWTAFAREARDVAQLSRMKGRRFIQQAHALKKENDKPAPAPGAMEVFTTMAEDDRQKADAMADLLERLKLLYASLDDKQRMQFDGRILQAQREPLGVQ
jgi:hypothetical protein